MKDEKQFGLARALSKMGYCSCSQAAVLIRAGRVSLNGRIFRDTETPVRIERDRIGLDGSATAERPRVYLAMNKPRGGGDFHIRRKGSPHGL